MSKACKTKLHCHLTELLSIGQPPSLSPNPDEDPLPGPEDRTPSENNSHDGQSHNDLVKINVTNEMGETKRHLTNGFVPEFGCQGRLKLKQFSLQGEK